MKVEVNQSHGEDIDYIQITFDGRQQFYVQEDKVDWTTNTLAKNFSGCFMIKAMLEKVYEAGQKNEPVEFQVNVYGQE
jgi:hypothetical protein